jgi:hypothetical protein
MAYVWEISECYILSTFITKIRNSDFVYALEVSYKEQPRLKMVYEISPESLAMPFVPTVILTAAR